MKPLKRFVRKGSILFLFIVLLVFAGRFSLSYFSEAMETYTKSIIIGYATQVIDEGISEGVVAVSYTHLTLPTTP